MNRPSLLLLSYDFPPAGRWGVAQHVGILAHEMLDHFDTHVATRGRGTPKDATVLSCALADEYLIESAFDPLAAYTDFEHLMAWCLLFASRLGRHFDATGSVPDLVHNHTWMTFPVALAMKRRYGARLVSTLHFLERQFAGLDFFPTIPDFNDIVAIENQIINYSDSLIVFGETHRRFVQIHYGAPPGRLEVIPHGVDTQALSKWRARPDHAEESVNIHFVGRLVPEKGLREVLHAVERLHALYPQVRLYLTGDGPLRRMLPPRDYMHFRGVVSPIEVLSMHRRAHIFCLPSYTETFGLATLEAMGCGLPIVTSRGESVTRLLNDEEAIFIDVHSDPPRIDAVQLAEQLERLILSPELRAQMGQRAFEAAHRYNLRDMLDRTRQAYMRALSAASIDPSA